MPSSPYPVVWLVAMFDLPVVERSQAKAASQFRNSLLDLGFEMSQYSIYLKHCRSAARGKAVAEKVVSMVPQPGSLHILTITDKQFDRMIRVMSLDKKRVTQPEQLSLF